MPTDAKKPRRARFRPKSYWKLSKEKSKAGGEDAGDSDVREAVFCLEEETAYSPGLEHDYAKPKHVCYLCMCL